MVPRLVFARKRKPRNVAYSRSARYSMGFFPPGETGVSNHVFVALELPRCCTASSTSERTSSKRSRCVECNGEPDNHLEYVVLDTPNISPRRSILRPEISRRRSACGDAVL